uniref:WD_REPEATS_REGION domain-containing protein n=2 Tax=Mesocestoides corti TaxID=53468 RepID=A0A5K3FHM4_MESCO
MSPRSTPPRIPLEPDEEIEDDAEYLLEGEPFEIVSDHSDQEVASDNEAEMQDVSPLPDDSILLLQKHQESVFCVAVHPSAKYIVSGAQDHTAVIWDATTGVDVFTCTGHEDSVTNVAFSPGDGKFLATGDMAGGVQIWSSDASTPGGWSLHRSLTFSDLLWLKWWRGPTSSNQKAGPLVLLTGSVDGIVSACLVTSRANDDRPLKYLVGPGSAAIGAEIVPSTYATERPYIAVMYSDGDFRVWDLKTEQSVLTATLTPPSQSPLEGDDAMDGEASAGYLCMAAPHSVPGRECIDIAAVGSFEQITIIPCKPPPSDETGSKKLPANKLSCISLESAGTVEALEFSWTHPFLAFGTVSGLIGIYDTSCMRLRQQWTYTDPTSGTDMGFGITALKWSQTEPVFFTSTLAATVVSWSALSRELGDGGVGVPLAVWRGHTHAVLDIVLAPPIMGSRPAFIASASDDATVRLFDLTGPTSNDCDT